MLKRKVSDLAYDSKTKTKLLGEATKLFAIKGFDAVSIRDIGKAVGIKSSSIYNHYANKDALLEDVLSCFETSYRNYFHWLTAENEKATSLEEVMDNMFVELTNVQSRSTYYGIALALKAQFDNESARKRIFKLFYVDSVQLIQSDFDRLVEKNIIPPCSSKTIATLFIHSVLIGNDMRIHEFMGHDVPVDVTEMYLDLKQVITAMLKNGV